MNIVTDVIFPLLAVLSIGVVLIVGAFAVLRSGVPAYKELAAGLDPAQLAQEGGDPLDDTALAALIDQLLSDNPAAEQAAVQTLAARATPAQLAEVFEQAKQRTERDVHTNDPRRVRLALNLQKLRASAGVQGGVSEAAGAGGELTSAD